MPRSSRHKSHREHKHGSLDERELSDSEEGGSSRYRRPKGEEPAGGGSGTRFSRDQESERRKSSSLLQPSVGKDYDCSGNGDASVERGRKRKERAEDDDAADLGRKGERFSPVDSEKAARSSRRHEGSPERYEESGGKVESVKRQSGKDSSHRDSTSRYRDAKERDKVRRSEKDRKVARTASYEEDWVAKKDKEISEQRIQDKSRNIELHKELDKRRRRSDCSVDRDKWQGHGRDADDGRSSARDDRRKGERRDGRYRDKYRDESDRDLRYWDDRHRDEHSSRDHTSDRSDIKHYRDETKSSESRYQNNKLPDSDYEGGSCVEDHSAKHKNTRGRKRSFDEDNDYSDFKPQGMKEPHGDVEKNTSNISKSDLCAERARLECQCPYQVNSSLSTNHLKNSPCSSTHAIMDKNRLGSKQADSARQELSEERCGPRSTTVGDVAGVLGGHQKSSDSRSFRNSGPKDSTNSGENLIETDRTPRSDGQSSPALLAEKSPTANDRRYSNKSGARCSIGNEDVVQNSSTFGNGRDNGRDFSAIDGREQELPLQNPVLNNRSQKDLENRERASVGPSSNWNVHFSSSSPGHLPPLPPARYRVNCPSLGSYEDDTRRQMGDHKSSSQRKRNSNLNTGMGQGNAWKSGPWLSPITNGFLPFQNGPRPPRYHSPMRQFSAPPLYGLRPSMDMNNANSAGVSYHMHEAANRFCGHIRPFLWDNPVEDSCPQLKGWGGSNGMVGHDSHFYGKPDWDQNRHLMGSQGWEMNADMWEGENRTMNIHFPQSKKEPEYPTLAPSDEACSSPFTPQSRSELARLESTEIKSSISATSPENASEATPECEKKPKLSNASSEDGNQMCGSYLSKLDISTELACLELYNQCKTLLGKNIISGVCNAPKHESQTIKDENKVVYKRPNFMLPSLFPTNAEAVFQRAMSLYKKQSEITKVELPSPSVCCEEEKNYPVASNLKKVKVVGDGSHEDEAMRNAAPRSIPEEEQSNILIDAEGDLPSDAMEQQTNISAEGNTDIEVVGDHPGHAKGWEDTDTDAGSSISGDAIEGQSDIIADAVVFVDGSQAFEAVMPECRVNLNWRPNSAESTY